MHVNRTSVTLYGTIHHLSASSYTCSLALHMQMSVCMKFVCLLAVGVDKQFRELNVYRTLTVCIS